jgi:hypothetical protein
MSPSFLPRPTSSPAPVRRLALPKPKGFLLLLSRLCGGSPGRRCILRWRRRRGDRTGRRGAETMSPCWLNRCPKRLTAAVRGGAGPASRTFGFSPRAEASSARSAIRPYKVVFFELAPIFVSCSHFGVPDHRPPVAP